MIPKNNEEGEKLVQNFIDLLLNFENLMLDEPDILNKILKIILGFIKENNEKNQETWIFIIQNILISIKKQIIL